MSLERDTRTGLFGTHWWVLEIAKSRDVQSPRRQLVLEPYSPLSMGTSTCLNAWVEEERAFYHWESDRIDRKPKGPPTFRKEWRRLDETMRHGCSGIPSLGFTIIRALARNELVGESAKEAVHGIFWAAFVTNTDGLNYLVRHADTETGEFYARQQLDWQTNTLRRTQDGEKDAVAALLVAATREDHPMLGLRAWERAVVDDAFYDALAAIAALADTEERTASTIAFLQLHKSKRTP